MNGKEIETEITERKLAGKTLEDHKAGEVKAK